MLGLDEANIKFSRNT